MNWRQLICPQVCHKVPDWDIFPYFPISFASAFIRREECSICFVEVHQIIFRTGTLKQNYMAETTGDIQASLSTRCDKVDEWLVWSILCFMTRLSKNQMDAV